MEGFLDGLAFAGIIAAQFLAVVTLHKAKRTGGMFSPSDSFDQAMCAHDVGADGREQGPAALPHRLSRPPVSSSR